LPPGLTPEMAQGMTKDKFKAVVGVSAVPPSWLARRAEPQA
jgi:hypothetical protein